MQGSNLGLYQWHLAITFMSFSKKRISASELQRQMGTRNHDTVWSLMHRIRGAMGDRDSLYGLSDMQKVDKSSVVFNYMSTSYTPFSKYVDTHSTVKSSKVSTCNTLQWVHIVIANLTGTLLGVYHRINQEYLQLYLDEFCYKLNRRYFKDSFLERLVIAAVGN
jgi:hypothetical protein